MAAEISAGKRPLPGDATRRILTITSGSSTMNGRVSNGLMLAMAIVAAQLMAAPAASGKELKVLSDKTVSTVINESVAYDPKEKVYYAGDFGGPASKSGDKDGTGKIVKLSLDGKVMDSGISPAPDSRPSINQ